MGNVGSCNKINNRTKVLEPRIQCGPKEVNRIVGLLCITKGSKKRRAVQ